MDDRAGNAPFSDAQLLRLLAWLSPAFPVGGYAFSHGLEAAVEDGAVADRAVLVAWIDAILRHGSGLSDGAFLAHAWAAVRVGDAGRLAAVADHADAFRPTAELALESAAQGRAFVAAIAAGWPELWAGDVGSIMRDRSPAPAYAVAIGAAAAGAGIALKPVLLAFLQAFAGALVSAGVRLIPLGQTDGVKALAALEPAVTATAAAAAGLALNALGSATWMVDAASARHETQYTRLFRS